MYITKNYDENVSLIKMCKKLYSKIMFTSYNFPKLENCIDKQLDRALRAFLTLVGARHENSPGDPC